MKILFITIFSLVLTICSSLENSEVEIVAKYDSEKFAVKIPLKNHFVLFFTPWSSECKAIFPIWDEMGHKVSSENQSEIVIAKVDCTVETSLCEEQDITEYPTIKFYKTNQEGALRMAKFKGVRDFPSIESFMNFNLGGEKIHGGRLQMIAEPLMGLHILVDENFDNAVTEFTHSFIKFCASWSSKCHGVDELWKEVAKEFQYEDGFLVGQVDCTVHTTTCRENEIKQYPSFVWFDEGERKERYEKEVTYDSLKKYILDKLGKDDVRKPTISKTDEDDEDPVTTNALKLDETNYDQTLKDVKIVFVYYWAPWCSTCSQSLDTIYEEIADFFNNSELSQKDKSKLILAKVDCSRTKALCDNIEDMPTLNLFKDGNLVESYKGPITMKDIGEYVGGFVGKNMGEFDERQEL